MCTVYFKDGKPLECPRITLAQMHLLFEVSKVARTRVECQAHIGNNMVPVDFSMLDPEKTFGELYQPGGLRQNRAST